MPLEFPPPKLHPQPGYTAIRGSIVLFLIGFLLLQQGRAWTGTHNPSVAMAVAGRKRSRPRGSPDLFPFGATTHQYRYRYQRQYQQAATARTVTLAAAPTEEIVSIEADRDATKSPTREEPASGTENNSNDSDSENSTEQRPGTKSQEPSEPPDVPVPPASAWDVLAGNVAACLIASDVKRSSGLDGSSTGWTSWIEEKSSFRLKQCVDRMVFAEGSTGDGGAGTDGGEGNDAAMPTTTTGNSRDETLRWLKWMRATPAPMVVELSEEFRTAVDNALTQDDYDRMDRAAGRSQADEETADTTRSDFLGRIGCRLLLLPSGESLRDNLKTPPGAMVYGKLLYGGCKRYRILGTAGNNGGRRPPRRAGERTTIVPPGPSPRTAGWLQYGGPERNYEAIDMGPCGVLEVTLLPKDLKLGLLSARESPDPGADSLQLSAGDGPPMPPLELQPTEEMVASKATSFDPQWLFGFPPEDAGNATDAGDGLIARNETSPDGDGCASVEEIETRFSSVLGGLRNEIQSIVRRVLDGRSRGSGGGTASNSELQTMLELGLSPVRGLLLYGKPGCGKTALAREISRLLTDRPPVIVSAPELLDRWVGGTETSVRRLFEAAEAELAVCGGDPAKSGLHVVVIDEIDAVFRQRSSSSGSGEVARASAVNQILAKLDGVNALGNILVIGTTNRRELLDEALLRPGRLEVKIEVPLPDREGRREILKIYFDPLRSRGRLSKPLCSAIDGGRSRGSSSGTEDDPRNPKGQALGKRERMRSFLSERLSRRVGSGAGPPVLDLAADRWTGGFSGADLEGLVRCAGSLALSRARRDGSGVDGLLITTEDVVRALREVKQ